MFLQSIIPLLFLIYAQVHSQSNETKLSFIDAKLEDFVMRVMAEHEDRDQFKIYFAQLTQKMQEAKEKEPLKERATYRYLYNLALEKLQAKHHDWYQEIVPFVSNPICTLDEHLDEVRNTIKYFLTRYGAYEEYLNYRATKLVQQTLPEESEGIWQTIKGYAATAKDKIAGLFKFGKPNQKLA